MLNDILKKDNSKRFFFMIGLATAGFAVSLAAGNSVLFSAGCCVILGVIGFFAPSFMEKRRKKKKLRMYEIDMADYLIGVTLLLSSGLTLGDSLRRALTGADIKKPLYRDIARLFDGIDAGKYGSLVDAFESFASGCGSPSVSTLTAVIVQNYKKGSGEIAELFYELSMSARNSRKYMCMKLADEASTLLLIPSTMVLIALVMLLLTPAVMTLMEI